MRRSTWAAQWEKQDLEAPCTSDPSARPTSRPMATADGPCSMWMGSRCRTAPKPSPLRLLIARDNRLMAPLTPLCIHHTHHTHTCQTPR